MAGFPRYCWGAKSSCAYMVNSNLFRIIGWPTFRSTSLSLSIRFAIICDTCFDRVEICIVVWGIELSKYLLLGLIADVGCEIGSESVLFIHTVWGKYVFGLLVDFFVVNIYFPIFKTNNYYFKYWEININKKMYYYVLVLYLMFFLYLYYFPNLYFIFIFEP